MMSDSLPVFTVRDLNFYYCAKIALSNIHIDIGRNQVTALIGPSGCGKSTFLRCLNRMNDRIAHTRVEGQILFNQQDIYSQDYDLTDLRRRIGMVFQKPNPFPKSVYENVAYGPRMLHIASKKDAMIELIKNSLVSVGLWDELKDHLNENALNLSLGQQQQLCLARVLALDPEVILMDEPASALDPIATSKLEELIFELRERYSIVIVTHNMQQAARISDMTGFFWLGELIEFNQTTRLFTNPQEELTEMYITGRMG
jgi:phosphate transport system ATP-binding protein